MTGSNKGTIDRLLSGWRTAGADRGTNDGIGVSRVVSYRFAGFVSAAVCCGLLVALALAQEIKPEETEVWEPEPLVVTPGLNQAPPSDALVLFDGRDLSEWTGENGGPAGWRFEGGAATVVPGAGSIRTKRSFGDVQLHIEWRTPAQVRGESQGRGNSGVYLMGLYEVQVLDSYMNRTYSNGQAGAVYKQHIPLVNASRPPGEWQSYDIVFRAPVFDDAGSVIRPAIVTVFHNGVLIQDHVRILGPTVYAGLPKYEPHPNKLPLMLQDHGNPVSYRNIWVREL